jgi:hypothetical protein
MPPDSSAKSRDPDWQGLVSSAVARNALLAFGDIANEREDGEEFLGRNRRPKQTEMLKDLKFSLSHVATRQ